MPAGSHRQGDAVQRLGCHTARLRRQTNASLCRSIAAPPKKVQPSIFCESRARANAWQPGVDVDESTAGVPPYLGKESSVRVAGQEDVQSPVVVKIAPGDRTIVNSRQANVDVDESTAGVPPYLANCT